jgi:hypothetical protein
MKVIEKDLGTLRPKYPIGNFCIPKQTLFIDIETTGLHAGSSNLYMIGCVYYDCAKEPVTWRLVQWFATNYEDEVNVLNAFSEFALSYKYLIHFNGNSFDIPYLKAKLAQHNIALNLDDFVGIDIFRRILPYKSFLKLQDCKQKTIENVVLDSAREDKYSGGELIEIYHDYVLDHDMEKERLLLLHNEEDVKGMLEIVSVLAIPDLFDKPVTVQKVQANHYKNINQEQCSEIIMDLILPTPLPCEITYSKNDCFLSGRGETARLRVPIFEGELKYFYSNYKQYYYLPKEDIAMHKSVAGFVDKEYRKQANARNCYTRKVSAYLPQWCIEVQPFFKAEYDDKVTYFELTDEVKRDRELFNRYAHHVICMLGEKL